MQDKIEINDFVNIIIGQRNTALNNLAEALANVEALKRKVKLITEDNSIS